MGLSPMMRQYRATKEKYPDCLLFYRLGDFYEMFFEDAVTASGILDLTLTGRDCGLEERAPMCGVPFHAVDNYVAKLLEHGYKVAICEQLTLPEESKGLVDRDVVRVITPGTVMESNILEEGKNNFFVSISGKAGSYGLAYADLSTGELFLTEFKGRTALKDLEDFLVKLSPAEIIASPEVYAEREQIAALTYGLLPKLNRYYDWAFETETAEKALKNCLGVRSLAAFSCENKKLAIGAGGALIEYFNETQKRALKHITRLQYLNRSSCMVLDANTFRSLEILRSMRENSKRGTLFEILDKTRTPMGRRLLTAFLERPLLDLDRINARLDAVEEFKDNLSVRDKLDRLLRSMRDLERLVGKISYGSANPPDLVALKVSLGLLPEIREQLSLCRTALLNECRDQIRLFDEAVRLLELSLAENGPTNTRECGFIRDGYNKDLDELRFIDQHGQKWVEEFEGKIRTSTGIKNLKVGFNRVFGYYIEVPKSAAGQVPFDFTRKQTLANAERYITPELKDMENKILGAKEQALRLEQRLFAEICSAMTELIPDIQTTAKAVALTDVMLSFAAVAVQNRYCKPVMRPLGERTVLKNGRHPVVEVYSKEPFVGNDTFLDAEDRTMIITGPNMAGKSTYMRQVALITLMAHVGSFVPCSEAEIALTDRIFTRVGASDNLLFDQSTFMVEMTEVAGILNSATANSLLVLDEVGRGTSTFDGLSIAWAVVEYISKHIKAKTMFATHYHELTELEGTLDGVRNYHVAVRETREGIVFLRKIQPGGANKSFGIEVAALAGIPKPVLSRAKAILKQVEEADINNPRSKSAQISFRLDDPEPEITEQRSEIEEEIKELDINQMTPMEALTLLQNWKEKLA